MLPIEVETERVRVMSAELRSKGTIAVFDLLLRLTDDHGKTPVLMLRDVWLNQRTDPTSGEKYYTLRSTEYPGKEGANVNPKTGKPYTNVPFTLFPGRNENGNVGFFPDRNNAIYQKLIKTLLDKVNEQAGQTQTQPAPKTTTSTSPNTSSRTSLL